MKSLKHLFYFLFGTKAKTKTSTGYIFQGRYFNRDGSVSAGDLVCTMPTHKPHLLGQLGTQPENPWPRA
ncbi:MAG: hypothetical protein KAR40_13810 [Candidatus Sabulitectum sp.]|nr:hypothetical protein [Candidatus Sabulitectum sp.]